MRLTTITQFGNYVPGEGWYANPRAVPPEVLAKQPFKPIGPFKEPYNPYRGQPVYNTPFGVERPEPGRGFWENPQRIAKYYNYIKTRPPNEPLPDWINPEAISQAYKWMEFRNEGRSPEEWKWLPQDDPAIPFLNSLPTPKEIPLYTPPPQNQPLTEAEKLYSQGNYNLLPWWQKGMLLFYPQPQNIPGITPEAKVEAGLAQGVLSGLGTYGAIVGGAELLGGILGTGVAPGVGTAAGLIAALPIGALMAYQVATGNQVLPVNFDQLFNIFMIPATGAMKAIGTAEQVYHEIPEMGAGAAITDLINDFPHYWQAAKFTYTSAPIQIANLLASLSGERTPGPNEKWAFEYGIPTPVPVQGGPVEFGPEALEHFREELDRGASIEELYAEATDRYGFAGSINEFAGLTIIDPVKMARVATPRLAEAVGELAGNDRLVAAARMSKGSLAVDLMPTFMDSVVELLSGKHGSQGLMGLIRNYRTAIRTGFGAPKLSTGETVSADQLSALEKVIGNLTKEGRYKELEPAPEGSGLLHYFTHMTPDSQAIEFAALFDNTLRAILAESNLDPDSAVHMLKQMAQIDPVRTGEFMERLIKSPAGSTVSLAFKEVVGKTQWLDDLLATYHTADRQRSMLHQLAELWSGKSMKEFKDEPSRLLDAIMKDPEGQLKVLTDRARASDTPFAKEFLKSVESGQITPDILKRTFSIFSGKDSVPLTQTEFYARMGNAMQTKLFDWLKAHYDLKPNASIFRLGSLLKSAQSLLLLSLSPAYLVNNAINNIVSRAVEGVLGFIKPSRIASTWDRIGYAPARLAEGFGAAGEGIGFDTSAIHREVMSDDLIAKYQRALRKTGNTIGIFTKLSQSVEKAESRQATTIGFLRFWDSTWKPGVGFRRMSPDVEAALAKYDPKLPELIYKQIRSGMNMKEIVSAVFENITKVSVSKVLDEVAEKLFPDRPDVARDLIKSTGLADELQERLKGASTPQDVERAFSSVMETLQSRIDEKFGRDLATRAEEVANQVKSEGAVTAISLFHDLQETVMMRRVQHFMEMENAFDAAYKEDYETGSKIIDSALAQSSMSFKRLHDWELQTIVGILHGLGIDSPASKEFVESLIGIHDSYRAFYDGYDTEVVQPDGTKKVVHQPGRNDLYREFYETKFESPEERVAAREKLRERLNAMYNEMTDKELALMRSMIDRFGEMFEAHTGRPAAEAKAAFQPVVEFREKYINAMKTFRERLAGMSIEQRRAAWTKAVDEIFRPLIVAEKRAEIKAAFELKYGRAPTTEAQPAAQPAAQPKAQTVFDVAHRYGIASVSEKGAYNDKYLLNIINKHSETKYTDIREVPLDVAESAFQKHASEHNNPAVENAEAAAAAHVDAQSAAREAEKAPTGEDYHATPEARPVRRVQVGISSVRGREIGPLDPIVEEHLRVMDTAKLREDVQPAIEYLKTVFADYDVNVDFCLGKYLGST